MRAVATPLPRGWQAVGPRRRDDTGEKGADEFLVDEVDKELRQAFRSLHLAVCDELGRTGGPPPLRRADRPGRFRPVLAPLAVAVAVSALVVGAWVTVERSTNGSNRPDGDVAAAPTRSPALTPLPTAATTTTAAATTPAATTATSPASCRAGELRDLSGTGNHARVVGTPRVAGSGPFGEPVLEVSGKGEWLQTTLGAPQGQGTTVALWLRTAEAGGIVAQYASSQTSPTPGMYDRMLYLTSRGHVVFGVYPDSGGPVTVTSPSTFADGRWHHVAGSVGLQGLRLVVDGRLVASSTTPVSGQSFVGWWRFADGRGGWPGTTASTGFRGSLAQVATWNAQLSDDELASLANPRTPSGPASTVLTTASSALTGYWPLDAVC